MDQYLVVRQDSGHKILWRFCFVVPVAVGFAAARPSPANRHLPPAHRPPASEEIARLRVDPGVEHAAPGVQAGAPSAFVVFHEFAAAAAGLRRFRA